MSCNTGSLKEKLEKLAEVKKHTGEPSCWEDRRQGKQFREMFYEGQTRGHLLDQMEERKRTAIDVENDRNGSALNPRNDIVSVLQDSGNDQ